MSKKISFNIILVLFLFLFLVTLPITIPFLRKGIGLAPIGSGSGWEIDQQLFKVVFNGDVYEQDTGSPDITAGYIQYLGGFTSGGFVSNPVRLSPFSDDYNFLEDPDGEPHLENNQLVGRASAFYIVQSGWRRVNQNGLRLNFDAVDLLQQSHQVGDKTVYEYYYEFDIRGGTESDVFPLAGIQLCECSSVEAIASVKVLLQETIFGPVEGYFQDATIIDYDHQDLQLQSGLDFDIHPSVSPKAKGFILEIQDREDTEDAYSCLINIPFTMNAGTTKTGAVLLSRNPYDVWIDYTVRFTILLEEPLDIGTQGTNLTGGQAPVYIPPYDWRVVLIIVAVIVVILAAICIVTRRR